MNNVVIINITLHNNFDLQLGNLASNTSVSFSKNELLSLSQFTPSIIKIGLRLAYC